MKTTTEQQKKNRLERLHDRLLSAMEGRPTSEEVREIEDPNDIAELIRAAEAENKKADTIKRVERYNVQEAAKREKLKRVLSIVLPSEDITNEDGTIHATKIRRFPELVKLQEDFRSVLLFWNGNAKRYTATSLEGEKFEIMSKEYGYNGAPDTFHDFTGFEAACSCNYIEPKPLNVKNVLRDIQKIVAEDKKTRLQLEKHNDKLKALNAQTLANFGAINRQSETRYTYFY